MRTAVRKNSFAKVLRLGFLTVLLSVLLCMAMPWAVFAGEQRVFDNAKLFDASEKEELEQKLSSFREEWQMDLGVLTTESTGRKTVESFADDFYDQQGMGEGSSHSGALIVIDMGTATTMCVVDKHGNYIGGIILPGLKVSLDSLSSKTAQLPYISLEVPSHVIGKNTIDCMRSGIIYGNVDMIDGILDRMEKELGEPPTIIATGGLAKFITPLCRHKILVDDALLLKGLLILYRKNMEVH